MTSAVPGRAGAARGAVEGRPRPGQAQLYATVDFDPARGVGRTRIVGDNQDNPKWNETFHIYCAHAVPEVVFRVKVAVPLDITVGRAYLPVTDLLQPPPPNNEINRCLDLLGKDRQPLPHGPKIHVRARFADVAADPRWGAGVGGAGDFPGVPRTFFKQRQGCRVTLYQDAHVADKFKPSVQLAGGRPYEPRRCWEDVYDAISDARHLVYITGWSLSTEITLVRDGSRPAHAAAGGGTTLGELLKRKAKEGVRVLMLVWDDPTSLLNLGILDGQLETHDAETFSYFRGSGVHCVPCPRNADASDGLVEGKMKLVFSHHQKCVVADVKGDADDQMGRRRIASFVGGLDLTSGRYDTQAHSLFRTLNTAAHANDFYQGNIDGAEVGRGGPREPWHDIHCRIEGPAAWDVLHNFQQRRKQGGKDDLLHNVLWPWNNQKDLLVDVKGMEDVIAPQTTPVVLGAGDQNETWNVQVFRSIDSSACSDFPKTPAEAASSGLVSGRDDVIDRSIQDAYIHAIRRAKRFVYIENQYFLGSSFAWAPPGDGVRLEDIAAVQLVPRELSLKIEAGEPFAVYVVVPMWPEGVPTSKTVQAILEWQRRTMEMMYSDIASALKAKNIEADPRDYLSFFCLGNREVKQLGEYQPKGHPPRGSAYDKAQKARRGMIYVHSKLMIVDDEYIIIGSANINQRSMDGGRDSEIAMGAYQPFHLNTKDQAAKGHIHGLRMSLWYEHLGELKDEFQDPGSLKCIQTVNKMAAHLWEPYVSDTLEADLPGHLLRYPVDVTSDGKVTELKGMKFVPDTEALVLGNTDKLVDIGGQYITSYYLTT